MQRKRITQIFPWLLPIRKKQRNFCFYIGMLLDGNHYSSCQSDINLPYQIFETKCSLYNKDTGFDMIYQENKVFNLKLVAATLNNLLIKPDETFSFWKSARYADRYCPYKDGLTVIDGHLTTAPGGGLCQISNLLFWMFLHTPLTFTERHGHAVKDFPDIQNDAPIGVDATVSEGWLDLKVKNETDVTFQINITFDSEYIIGRVLSDKEFDFNYEIFNSDSFYYRQNNSVFQKVNVNQSTILKSSGTCISSKSLYTNICKIGYRLPSDIKIIEKG